MEVTLHVHDTKKTGGTRKQDGSRKREGGRTDRYEEYHTITMLQNKKGKTEVSS
jgi:hypothetical protein